MNRFLCLPLPLAACLLAAFHGGELRAQSDAATALEIVRPPLLPDAITSFGACRVGPWLYVYGGHTGRAHQHSRDNVIGSFRRIDLDSGDGQWQELPEGPALQGTALVAAPDGSLYRVGGTDARNERGEDDDMHSTASVQRFDPEAMQWSDATPLPEARSSHDAIVCDGRLYVVGGWTLAGDEAPVWHDTAWVADLGQQPLVWQELPSPGVRRRACAVAAFDGRVAVLGGLGPDGMMRSVQVFDPATQKWQDGPELPGFAFGTAALGVGDSLCTTLGDGRIVRWNGRDDAWLPCARLETSRFFARLVPSTQPGRVVALGGAGRGGHLKTIEHPAIDGRAVAEVREYALPAPGKVALRQALVQRDNTLYALGGNRGLEGERFREEQFATDIWKVDLTAMAAEAFGELPEGRQSMATATLDGRRGELVVGGLGVVDGTVRSVDGALRFDPRQGRVVPFPAKLDMPRTACQVVRRGDLVYVIGGIDFRPDGGGDDEVTTGDPLDVLVCDLSAEEPAWRPSGIRLPRLRRSFGTALVGDRLYLIGGLGARFEHAGPCDVYDFGDGSWSELDAPTAWVSPQIAVIEGRVHVACGGTMRGQRFTEDRSVVVFDEAAGWRTIVEELPFGVRNVQMLARGNRLLFYAIEDGEVRIRTFEPDATVMAPDASAHG